MVKIKIKSKVVRYLGSEVVEGDVVEVDDQTAKVWIQNGRAELEAAKSKTSSDDSNEHPPESLGSGKDTEKDANKESKTPQVKADKKSSQER